MKKLISLVVVILISLNSYSQDTLNAWNSQQDAIDNPVNVTLLDYSDISEIVVGDIYQKILVGEDSSSFNSAIIFTVKVKSINTLNETFELEFNTNMSITWMKYDSTNASTINNYYTISNYDTKIYSINNSIEFRIGLKFATPNDDKTYIYFDFSLNSTVGFGDNDFKTEPKINIFPNPVVNELNITSTDMSNVVKIYDMSGRMIFSKVITSNDKIDMTVYNKGTYIVVIDDRISKKIIKQ